MLIKLTQHMLIATFPTGYTLITLQAKLISVDTLIFCMLLLFKFQETHLFGLTTASLMVCLTYKQYLKTFTNSALSKLMSNTTFKLLLN